MHFGDKAPQSYIVDKGMIVRVSKVNTYSGPEGSSRIPAILQNFVQIITQGIEA